MVKKISLIGLFFIFFSSELFGVNNRIALDIARAKEVERVIKRVNAIYELINLNIMETGTVLNGTPLNNMNTIINPYGNNDENRLRTSGYDGIAMGFTITNNVVEFENVFANNNSGMLQQIYTNSYELHPFATFNTVDNDIRMRIPLKAETITFLNKVEVIESLDVGNTVTISNGAPICDGTTVSNMWYRPDFRGDFVVSFCLLDATVVPNIFRWEIVSNKLDITIYRNVNQCNNITFVPPMGTRAYVNDTVPDPDEVQECIYDGIVWRRVRIN